MTRIDRRALFTSGVAATLLAASGLSAVAQPKRGGRLRLALARDSGSFDAVMRGAVFDTLTEVAPDGVLRGELATGWHGSADAKTWQFDLRPDAFFHDGGAVTAEDVLASLPELDGLVATETNGSGRIRLTFDAAKPDLPLMLSDPGLGIAPGGDRSAGVGSGLYRVERMQDGRQFLGARVVGHYRDEHAGWADQVELITISDPAVRAEALRDGFVDVAELPEPKGLGGRGGFVYHPSAEDMALAISPAIGLPARISSRAPMDDGRIAERWWIA